MRLPRAARLRREEHVGPRSVARAKNLASEHEHGAQLPRLLAANRRIAGRLDAGVSTAHGWVNDPLSRDRSRRALRRDPRTLAPCGRTRLGYGERVLVGAARVSMRANREPGKPGEELSLGATGRKAGGSPSWVRGVASRGGSSRALPFPDHGHPRAGPRDPGHRPADLPASSNRSRRGRVAPEFRLRLESARRGHRRFASRLGRRLRARPHGAMRASTELMNHWKFVRLCSSMSLE